VDFARPPELAQHRLPVEYLDVLSSGAGSPEITRFLWTTEFSRRLLLICTLFKHCEGPDALGPLPPAAAAWSVLSRAREADRAAVDDLLLHPQIGNAAAYCLRRARSGTRSEFPIWVDFGLVHIIALIAATRAGLTWSTTLPARYGTVILPTLGLAKFSAKVAASAVEARTEGGRIYLIAGGHKVVVESDLMDDTDDWWHMRHILVGKDPTLTVWLDDLDPFRDLADPVPPARLDAGTFELWGQLLGDAWTLLCEHHAGSAAALAEGVVSLVPLPVQPGNDNRSASNGEAFGSVMVSTPPDAVTLAVALVHEFQHIKLGALMHLVELSKADDGTLHYAPWRDDPRPLGGFVQGIYAFFGIADFWRRHRLTVSGPDALLADYEYLYARGQTSEALWSISDMSALTDAGRDLVLKLGSVLETWHADQTAPEVTRLARLTADGHRAAWRLRHRHVEAAEAAALAKDWRGGRPPEVPSVPLVRSAPPVRWPQRIPTLARQRFLGTVPAASTDPLAAADLALVHGHVAAASNAYLARLARPSDGSDDEILAWVGLALALSDSGNDGAATALLGRPDLVRAVHHEARVQSRGAVDPVEIATWLGPVAKNG
jgi:HEXXH motif-containing protein